MNRLDLHANMFVTDALCRMVAASLYVKLDVNKNHWDCLAKYVIDWVSSIVLWGKYLEILNFAWKTVKTTDFGLHTN